jgi:patatin-like phospholipase/acyl hydrolase
MPLQILSLSGGGYLGLYTAAVLTAIEERIKARIATRFDLIAGTSVGGIIALGIANEVPAGASTRRSVKRIRPPDFLGETQCRAGSVL